MISNQKTFYDLLNSQSELNTIKSRLPKADQKELFEGFDYYLNLEDKKEQEKIIEIFKYLEEKNNLLENNKENISNNIFRKNTNHEIIKNIILLIKYYIGYKDNTHLFYLNKIKNNTNYQNFLNYYNIARENLKLKKITISYSDAAILGKVNKWIYLIPAINENVVKNDVVLLIQKKNQRFLNLYIQNYIENINDLFYKKKSILHYAAIYDNLDLVKLLFERYDLDLKVMDENNKTPLDLANKSNTEICDILSSNNEQKIENIFKNLFQELKSKNDSSALNTLEGILQLKGKYDINSFVDDNNDNTIVIATKENCEKSLEFLLKNFDINLKITGNKGTLFHHIGTEKILNVIKKYVKNNELVESLKINDNNGNSVLHSAAKNLCMSYVHFLVSNFNFKADLMNNNRETVLHVLTRSDTENGALYLLWLPILKYLVYYGDGDLCIINTDKNGKTIFDNINNNILENGNLDRSLGRNHTMDEKRKLKVTNFLNNPELHSFKSKLKFITLVLLISYYIKQWIGFSPLFKAKGNIKQISFKEKSYKLIKSISQISKSTYSIIKNVILFPINTNCCCNMILSMLFSCFAMGVYICPLFCTAILILTSIFIPVLILCLSVFEA